MNTQKIIPNLWFVAEGGRVKQVIEYYERIFGDNLSIKSVTPLGETPSGNSEISELTIFGQEYTFLCTTKEHHKLNDAFSLTILCKDQAEIDYYWDYFTAEGEPSQCGWCIDKYGLLWQIVPENMNKLILHGSKFSITFCNNMFSDKQLHPFVFFNKFIRANANNQFISQLRRLS